MILDSARVTLMDGSLRQAIDLNPGAEVLTVRNQRPKPAPLVDRRIENHNDIICLILSNGDRLIGSRDLRIGVFHNRRMSFRQMADVEIGSDLRGQVAGTMTTVRVIGVLRFAKREMRLVGFQFADDETFVVEGVLCRC